MEDASEQIRKNKEIAKMCVGLDWRAFKYLDDELRDDPEIVEMAVQLDWRAISYAGECSRDNAGIMMLVVSQCGEAFKYASGTRDDQSLSWRLSDQETALSMRQKDSIRLDCRLAVQEEPYALNFAHPSASGL